jgi:DNA-directed RNA polymerase specialized sigma24 family protein
MTDYTKPKRQKHDYVDNKRLFREMCEFKAALLEAENCDDEKPMVPDYVAVSILEISRHLAMRPNFINYPFREEMISDGVENCFQYIENFKPEKSNNPFSYFTMIIYNAFLRRIKKEKRQLYTVYKVAEHANIFSLTAHTDDGDKTNYNIPSQNSEYTEEYMSDFAKNFEESADKAERKERKRIEIKGIDQYMQEE